LELPATVPSGFCLASILYFFLGIQLPAHWRAAAHFFSEISCLRCARGLGSDIGRAPACSHSTLRASGSSAARLAHSSAFSLPGTPLCAGHYRMSMVMSGLALSSALEIAARRYTIPERVTIFTDAQAANRRMASEEPRPGQLYAIQARRHIAEPKQPPTSQTHR
jgi:hypothetical protein